LTAKKNKKSNQDYVQIIQSLISLHRRVVLQPITIFTPSHQTMQN